MATVLPCAGLAPQPRGREVAADGGHRRVIAIDEHGPGRAARERFDRERAAPAANPARTASTSGSGPNARTAIPSPGRSSAAAPALAAKRKPPAAPAITRSPSVASPVAIAPSPIDSSALEQELDCIAEQVLDLLAQLRVLDKVGSPSRICSATARLEDDGLVAGSVPA